MDKLNKSNLEVAKIAKRLLKTVKTDITEVNEREKKLEERINDMEHLIEGLQEEIRALWNKIYE